MRPQDYLAILSSLFLLLGCDEVVKASTAHVADAAVALTDAAPADSSGASYEDANSDAHSLDVVIDAHRSGKDACAPVADVGTSDAKKSADVVMVSDTGTVDDVDTPESDGELLDVLDGDGASGIQQDTIDIDDAADVADVPDVVVQVLDAAQIDATGDSSGGDAVALGGDATATGCAPAPEVCDGVDNDCDGLTDEDFVFKAPMFSQSLKIGQSCANPMCPNGVVVCHNKKYTWCSTCPKPLKLDAQLAPKGAKKSALTATGGFVDVTSQLPLKSLVPKLGSPLQVPAGLSGMALDVDADGDLDLVWLHGEDTVTLLTQTSTWKFTATTLLKSNTPILALAATDQDADGVPEIVVGGSALAVLERKKDGSYAKSSVSADLQIPTKNASVQHILSADINGDGLLDLVVGIFTCSPTAQALRVFINRGGQGYVERSKWLGLSMKGSVWASMFSDYNNDGKLDLLVLTDSCAPKAGVGLYLRQPDPQPGSSSFVPYKLAQAANFFTAPNGPAEASPMGAAAADVNGDGVLDYLFSEIEMQGFEAFGGNLADIDLANPMLYAITSNVYSLSQPGGKRVDAGLQAGLWAPLSKTGKAMVAWSPVWADLDHDGHLDLLLSHGHELGSWITADLGGMRPVAFRHDGTGHFVDVSKAWGLPTKHASRSMVASDLDGDGDLDVVLGGQATGPKVLRNDLKHGGKDVHLRLVGTTSNRWGLGARVALHTNLRVLHAEMGAIAVTQTMATPVVHFALQANETALKVVVTWPTGWKGTTVLGAVAGAGQAVLGNAGWLTLTEPPLIKLSTRYSPSGQIPVTITAIDLAVNGTPKLNSKGCTIAFDSGSVGGFVGPTTCNNATCTRTWNGPGNVGADVAFVVTCGGKTWTTRPRVYL